MTTATGNNNNNERTAMIIGKFYPFHQGHEALLKSGIAFLTEQQQQQQQVDLSRMHVIVCYKRSEKPSGPLRESWVRELYPQVTVHLFEDLDYDERDSDLWAKLTIDILGFTPTDVFTSEHYGVKYCECLSERSKQLVQHHLVDLHRTVTPISGTQVRTTPLSSWQFISPPLRGYYALRIVLVGAESTGKSTLTAFLTNHFKTNSVEEYGRTYTIEKQQQQETSEISVEWFDEDFTRIANRQNEMEQEAARQCNQFLVCDTDSLATAIWHERYMTDAITEHKQDSNNNNKHNNRTKIQEETQQLIWQGFEELVENSHLPHRLYLLIDPAKVPFVQDGTRDGDDAIRNWMHNRFVEVLREKNMEYLLLQGTTFEERQNETVEIINKRLQSLLMNTKN